MRVSRLLPLLAAASLLSAATAILATRPLIPNATPRMHSLDLHDGNVQAYFAIADLMADICFDDEPPSVNFDFARARLRNTMKMHWVKSARQLIAGNHLRGMALREVEVALGPPFLKGRFRWIYFVGANAFLDDVCMWIGFDTYGQVARAELFDWMHLEDEAKRVQLLETVANEPWSVAQ